MPIEAAELHRALKDAESGKAQREKGEGLDIVVLEGTDLLDLEEGEVLKLPPTPDMTDGTEHQSDPETEQVHYHSRSVSQNSSTSDFKMLPPQRHNRNAPPPLPTRSRHRPVMVEHRSSTSHYSDPDDEEAVSTAIPSIPPRPTQGDLAKSHDAELTVPPVDAELTIPPVPSDEREPMSEVEGTEWDQYLAVQKEEEEEAIHGEEAAGDGNELHIPRANAADADEGPMTYTERSEWDEFVAAHKEEESGHGGGVDPAGLAERLAGQHLDKGEGEGLR